MGTLITKFLAGGAAGLLTWAIMEPSMPSTSDLEASMRWQGMFTLLFGAMVGLVVGGYDGYSRGGKVHLFRGLGLGFLFGAIGGTLGMGIGSGIVSLMFGSTAFSPTHGIAQVIPARIIALTLLGAGTGFAVGASSLNGKKILQGTIGGAIGGAIGGGAFDLIGAALGGAILAARGQTSGEVGQPSRAVAFTVMGAAIGLFIGIVEMVTRSAWIRVVYGRNEYKEWSIDSAQTYIGRNESATIPLRGDPNVQPIHAVIQKQGGSYYISDGGGPVGTMVNGQYIQQVQLQAGSVIQIASFVLHFMVKGTPAPAYIPDMGRSAPMGPNSPTPSYGAPPTPMPSAAPSFAPSQSMPTQAYASPLVGNQTVAYATQSSPLIGFTLVALDGPIAGQRFPVGGAIEIGREAANIKLTGDSNASRRHASVAPGTGGVRVSDLGSTNGTFLNGQRITNADARSGDVIKIGSTSFRVEAG